MPRSFLRMLFQVMVSCSCVFSVIAAQQATEPSIDDLTNAGRNTLDKLRSKSASWIAKFPISNGTNLQTKVVRDKGDQDWTFSIVVNGRDRQAARIVQTGGVWNVLDVDGSRSKWRPYEAELQLRNAYLFISLSAVRCVVDRTQFASARFEKREGSVVHYRQPLAEEARRALQQVIKEIGEMAAKDPTVMARPNVAEMLRSSREKLDKGLPLGIDERTGMVVESEAQGLLISVEQFQWLEKRPAEAFALPTTGDWKDETKAFPLSDLSDCLMVGHDPVFKSSESLSPEGYLLNLKTGQLRRLPYVGYATMPGAFLKDRREVIVSGFDTTGEMGLVKLNLLTGDNTPVEYGTFKGTVLAMADLSPDGKKLASLQTFGSGKLLDMQIRVIELETGKSQLLGKPARLGGPFSWLPEGDGLILKRFVPQEDSRAIESRIVCRLGLDGKLTDLCPGDWPVVLKKSRRILYSDDSKSWQTCQLDGTKPTLFAGGLKGYGTPAVSPDETRIVFVRYEKGKAPQLTLFEMDKADGRPAAPQASGFTGTPVWR